MGAPTANDYEYLNTMVDIFTRTVVVEVVDELDSIKDPKYDIGYYDR